MLKGLIYIYIRHRPPCVMLQTYVRVPLHPSKFGIVPVCSPWPTATPYTVRKVVSSNVRKREKSKRGWNFKMYATELVVLTWVMIYWLTLWYSSNFSLWPMLFFSLESLLQWCNLMIFDHLLQVIIHHGHSGTTQTFIVQRSALSAHIWVY